MRAIDSVREVRELSPGKLMTKKEAKIWVNKARVRAKLCRGTLLSPWPVGRLEL